jgi:hypothetical protein
MFLVAKASSGLTARIFSAPASYHIFVSKASDTSRKRLTCVFNCAISTSGGSFPVAITTDSCNDYWMGSEYMCIGSIEEMTDPKFIRGTRNKQRKCKPELDYQVHFHEQPSHS